MIQVSEIQKIIDMSEKQQILSLVYLLSLCEIELLAISITEKTYDFHPHFFDSAFIKNQYSSEGITMLHSFAEKHEVSPIKEGLEVFLDTINFLDQLPFEHLLIDTIQERKEILLRIKQNKEQLISLID